MKKQKSGLYRSRIKVGVDPQGKSVYKYVSGKTKKELEENKKKIIQKHITGIKTDTILFGTYAREWFEIRKKPFLAVGTQNLYRSALNKHILPEFADRNLPAIRALDVQQFLNRLADNGLSNSRINAIRTTMVSIFDCAMQDGYLDRNPAKHMRVGGTPAKEKYTLSPEERMRIEEVCRTHSDGLLLAILYYTGMRRGEACGLQWKHIDLKNRVIHIRQSMKQSGGDKIGSTKTPSSVRDVPIIRPLYEVFLKHPVGMPDSFVIHNLENDNPCGATCFMIRYGELMYAAGLAEYIPLEKRTHKSNRYKPLLSPHGLRHNFTTMCWESGDIDVYATAKLLGHSSIKTTMDTYTHLSTKGFQKTADKLENAIVAQRVQSTIEESRKG